MKSAVILAGQSNMVGHGQLSELGEIALPAKASLFDLNPRAAGFGPEIGFARRFLDIMPRDELWLIKYAVGGSSLLAWAPDWSAERAAIADDADKGALYPRLIRHVKNVMAGDEVELLACLWLQGESDSRFQRAAAEYQRNLTRLIMRLRADIGASGLPFVMGLVNPPRSRFAYLTVVQDAQRRVAQTVPKVSLISTDGLTKHPDEVHYDSAGQLELGRRFADQLALDLRRKCAASSAD